MRWFLYAAATLVLARIMTALVVPFTYHHGMNEAVYATISLHTLPLMTPHYHGAAFYDTPPLLTWAGSVVFRVAGLLPGSINWAVRVPSLAAWMVTIWATGEIFRLTGRKRETGILLASVAPGLFLWMGRNQTDPLMVACLAVSVLFSKKPGMGDYAGIPWALGLMAKQPFLLAFPVLLAWRREDRNAALASAAAGTFLVANWWLGQALTHGPDLEASIRFHLFGRVAGFNEIPGFMALFWVVVLGSGVVPLFWMDRARLWTGEGAALATFGVFTILDTPIGHEYYALPVLYLALLACRDPSRKKAAAGLCVAVLGIGLFMVDAGDWNRPVLQDAVYALPEGSWVDGTFQAPAEWWGRNVQVNGYGCLERVNGTLLCHVERGDCSTERVWEAWMGYKLYQMRC